MKKQNINKLSMGDIAICINAAKGLDLHAVRVQMRNHDGSFYGTDLSVERSCNGTGNYINPEDAITKINQNNFLFVATKPSHISNVILSDDFTDPRGGIAYIGETLKDFLLEVDMKDEISMDKINVTLKECGIFPISLKEEYIEITCYLDKLCTFSETYLNTHDNLATAKVRKDLFHSWFIKEKIAESEGCREKDFLESIYTADDVDSLIDFILERQEVVLYDNWNNDDGFVLSSNCKAYEELKKEVA